MPSTMIHGRCLCGAIEFEARANLDNVGVCHCTDCQTSSGAPFRVVVPVRTDNFTLTKGELKVFVKRADSGAERPQAFCGDCGTQIYGTGVGEAAKVLGLRAGVCAERAELVPKREIWCRSALDWVPELGIENRNQTG